MNRDEALDTIDVDFVTDLNEQWRLAPPPRLIVAAQAGYKPPEPKEYMTADAAREWMKRTGGKIMGVAGINGPRAP